jgi:two-component system, OmpR family, response regulator
MTDKPLRILLVEDDGSIARIIALAMHDIGVPYHLDQAYSAEEGLELWHQQPYDLVLSDYNLRGMNGIAMIALLKAEVANLPTILFTAYDDVPVRREAKKIGVSRFVAKPFVIDEFIHITRGLLPTRSNQLGTQSAT